MAKRNPRSISGRVAHVDERSGEVKLVTDSKDSVRILKEAAEIYSTMSASSRLSIDETLRRLEEEEKKNES